MRQLDLEGALVRRLRERRPDAIDELYRAHSGSVWRFLARLVGPNRVALAEDLFQETWLAAARNAHRLHEDTRLLPWLVTIARNKHRNTARLPGFEALEPHSAIEPTTPEVEAGKRAEGRALQRAFELLAEAHREVLLLSAVEGLEAEAMGRILGLRADAVRKRLSRARAELKRLMSGGHP